MSLHPPDFSPDSFMFPGTAANATASLLPLPVTNAASFQGAPVPQRLWHVPDMVPARTVTLLGGDGGVGKSLLALQLAVATVLGTYWAGKPVTRGACLFISAEDDIDELHRRLADCAAAEHVEMDDLHDLDLCSLAGTDAVLAAPQARTNIVKQTRLYDALELRIADSQPALIVLDTLADLFGGEENQRAQARQFVGLLRGLAVRHGATVLMLSHPSVAGMASGTGTSGSTAWNNSVRSRLYFDREKTDDGIEGDPDTRLLKTMKANYGRTGETVRMRWDRGVFKTVDMIEESEDRKAEMSRAETIFLDLLKAYTDEGRYVNPTSGPTFAPAVFAKDPRAEGIRKPGFTRAMNALFAAGKIKTEEYGPASKGKIRVVIVE